MTVWQNGRAALHVAVSHYEKLGRDQVVAALLEAEADPNLEAKVTDRCVC